MFLGFLSKLVETPSSIESGFTISLPPSYKYVGKLSVEAVNGDLCIL